MTVPEGIMVAAFCLAGVFVVLVALCFIIKLFSFALGSVARKRAAEPEATTFSPPVPAEQPAPCPVPVAASEPAPVAAPDASAGMLTLREVDEPTAAMIMAIVSDQSGIPLSELCFKSIRRIRKS